MTKMLELSDHYNRVPIITKRESCKNKWKEKVSSEKKKIKKGPNGYCRRKNTL